MTRPAGMAGRAPTARRTASPKAADARPPVLEIDFPGPRVSALQLRSGTSRLVSSPPAGTQRLTWARDTPGETASPFTAHH